MSLCAENIPAALVQRLPLVHDKLHGKRLFPALKQRFFAQTLLVHFVDLLCALWILSSDSPCSATHEFASLVSVINILLFAFVFKTITSHTGQPQGIRRADKC